MTIHMKVNYIMTETNLFAALLSAQPAPIRDAIQYQLCLLLVQAGRMELCCTVPGDTGPVCIFQDNLTGNLITVTMPSFGPCE
jgi:hypothetical protein